MVKINTFMVKVVAINSELSGYTWSNNKNAHIDGFVEVQADTLKQAVDEVRAKYNNKDKYWVKAGESYIVLK